jgi:hypothetical protein
MNFGINSHRNHLIYYVFSDMPLFTLMIAVHNSFTFVQLNYIHNYAYWYAITANSVCVYFITYSQRAVWLSILLTARIRFLTEEGIFLFGPISKGPLEPSRPLILFVCGVRRVQSEATDFSLVLVSRQLRCVLRHPSTFLLRGA